MKYPFKYPLEQNILIAEFMGMKHQSTKCLHDKTVKPIVVHRETELKYHDDWNWLMLVVERIEQLGITYIDIMRGGTRIHSYSFDADGTIYDDHPKLNFEEATKLIITYRAVISFIKWLNTKEDEE